MSFPASVPIPRRCWRSPACWRRRATRRGASAARCATRCSAIPTRTTTSPPRPRPAGGAARSSAAPRRSGVKYGTVGVLDRHARAARGHHLPPGRRAPTAATRWSRTASRSRRTSPAATSPSTPSPTTRCGDEWRDPFGGRARSRARRDPRGGRSGRSASGRTTSGFCAASASPRASGSRSIRRPGRRRERGRAGLAQLSAERVRDEWFKGLRTAQRPAARWCGSGTSRVPRRSGCPSCASADGGRPRRSARRRRRDPVLLTALLATRPGRRAPAAARRPTPRSRGRGDGARARRRRRARGEVAVRRWLAAVGPGRGRPARALRALRHGRATRRGSAPSRAIRERGDPLARGDLAVTGGDLQALGASGPRIGEMLGRAARPGAGRSRAQHPRAPARAGAGAAVTPLGFALAAALGNMVGALAVVRQPAPRAFGSSTPASPSGPGSCSRWPCSACCPRSCATAQAAALYVLGGLPRGAPGAARPHPPLPLRRGDPRRQPVGGRLGAARAHAAHLLRRRGDRERIPGLRASSGCCSSWPCCSTSCPRA